GGRTIQGHKQLAELARPDHEPGDNKGPASVSRVNVNIMIEPSPDGANGTAYFLRVKFGQKGEPNSLTARGVYRDTFVKSPGGWLIKRVSAEAEVLNVFHLN